MAKWQEGGEGLTELIRWHSGKKGETKSTDEMWLEGGLMAKWKDGAKWADSTAK